MEQKSIFNLNKNAVHPQGHHHRLLAICSQHSEGLDGAAFPVELSSQRSFLRSVQKVTSCHSPNVFLVCQEFIHEPEAHVHWEFNLIGNAFFLARKLYK